MNTCACWPEPGASLADRVALYEELFRPDWPAFDAASVPRFGWFGLLVQVGVPLGVLGVTPTSTA